MGMKIKEKLLNKFRNSFSKIRILKQLKLNQNKLKQFKLCSNKIKITKIKLQNKFKKLFKKKVQIRKLNQNFEKITKITDKLNQKLKISQLLNEKILQLNQQNQILRNISIFSKKFEKKKFPFAKIKFKNLKANKFQKKKKSLFSRLKFSGKNKLKFFFPRNFFDNSFLHRRDIIYWLNGKKRRKRKFYPEHYIHKDLTNKDENKTNMIKKKRNRKKNMTILNIFGLVNSKKES